MPFLNKTIFHQVILYTSVLCYLLRWAKLNIFNAWVMNHICNTKPFVKICQNDRYFYQWPNDLKNSIQTFQNLLRKKNRIMARDVIQWERKPGVYSQWTQITVISYEAVYPIVWHTSIVSVVFFLVIIFRQENANSELIVNVGSSRVILRSPVIWAWGKG